MTTDSIRDCGHPDDRRWFCGYCAAADPKLPKWVREAHQAYLDRQEERAVRAMNDALALVERTLEAR